MARYEVDPDALFSDEEDPELAPAPPSPKRPRVVPRAPAAPSLGPLRLPAFSSSMPSVQSAGPSRNPYFGAPPRAAYPSRTSRYGGPPPPSRGPGYHRSAPSFGLRAPPRPPQPLPHPPIHPPSYPPVRRLNHPPRAPMGRGRAATLPAHLSQASRPPAPAVTPAVPESIARAASILPEEDREKYIQQKLKERDLERTAPVERKRPGRRRRPDQADVQTIRNNVKNSRKGNLRGLNSLLQAAKSSETGLIQLERGKRHVRKPSNAAAAYAEATMTTQMMEREERERRRKEIEMEEEREEIRRHFTEMRVRERSERALKSKAWREEETVACGMRDAYRLARAERSLFGEEGDAKRCSLEPWGLRLRPLEEDKAVTDLMTIHVEEI